MQLNRADWVLEALTIGNRRVQVANFISFEAVNFGSYPVSGDWYPLGDGTRSLLAAEHTKSSVSRLQMEEKFVGSIFILQ